MKETGNANNNPFYEEVEEENNAAENPEEEVADYQEADQEPQNEEERNDLSLHFFAKELLYGFRRRISLQGKLRNPRQSQNRAIDHARKTR